MADLKIDNNIYSSNSSLFAIYHLIIDNCFLIKEILSNNEKRKIFKETFPDKRIGNIIDLIIDYKSLNKKKEYLESWTIFKQILKYMEPYNDKDKKGEDNNKDELYKNYIDNLFSMFFVWSFGLRAEIPLNSMIWENFEIKNLNGLEILFYLNSELNDYKLTQNLLNTLLTLVKNKPINGYKLIQNKIIISSVLDIVFNNINHGKDESREQCFKIGQSLLVNILTNSLLYIKQNKNYLK